jgi:hypothetical protein
MKNLQEQAIKEIEQANRLMDVCNIDKEDRSEPVFQIHDDTIHIEFEVYNLDLNLNTTLWGLLALMAAGIDTTVTKKTSSGRGVVKYEIKIPA